MTEVWVAAITALATLIGVALPLTMSSKKEKRDRQERAELERQRLLQERRAECAGLLRAARDYGVAVQDNYEYHGHDKTARVWDIRKQAAAITGQADEVGLLIAGLAAAADALADEVNRLVDGAADPQSMALGSSTQPEPPDTARLDRRIREFKSAAQAALYGAPSPSAPH